MNKEQYKIIFSTIDKNQSGTIDKKELYCYDNLFMTPSEIKERMKHPKEYLKQFDIYLNDFDTWLKDPINTNLTIKKNKDVINEQINKLKKIANAKTNSNINKASPLFEENIVSFNNAKKLYIKLKKNLTIIEKLFIECPKKKKKKKKGIYIWEDDLFNKISNNQNEIKYEQFLKFINGLIKEQTPRKQQKSPPVAPPAARTVAARAAARPVARAVAVRKTPVARTVAARAAAVRKTPVARTVAARAAARPVAPAARPAATPIMPNVPIKILKATPKGACDFIKRNFYKLHDNITNGLPYIKIIENFNNKNVNGDQHIDETEARTLLGQKSVNDFSKTFKTISAGKKKIDLYQWLIFNYLIDVNKLKIITRYDAVIFRNNIDKFKEEFKKICNIKELLQQQQQRIPPLRSQKLNIDPTKLSNPETKFNPTYTPRKRIQQHNKKLYNEIIIKLQKLLRISNYQKEMKYLDKNKITSIDIDNKFIENKLIELKNISDSIDTIIIPNINYLKLKNESKKLTNNTNSNIENGDIKVFLILEFFLKKYTKLNNLFSEYLIKDLLINSMFNINKINNSFNNTFKLPELLELLNELIDLKKNDVDQYKIKLTEYCDKIINLIKKLRFFIIDIKKDLIVLTIIKIDESRLTNVNRRLENINFDKDEINIVSGEMEGMKCCGITDEGKKIFNEVAEELKNKTTQDQVRKYLKGLAQNKKEDLYEVYSKLKESDNRDVFPEP